MVALGIGSLKEKLNGTVKIKSKHEPDAISSLLNLTENSNILSSSYIKKCITSLISIQELSVTNEYDNIIQLFEFIIDYFVSIIKPFIKDTTEKVSAEFLFCYLYCHFLSDIISNLWLFIL